ncbi:MAG: glutamate--cysteine ligase [Eubacteriales bacterium]
MNCRFLKFLDLFSDLEESKLLLEGKWGLEKESIRITKKGDIALTRHPSDFGDKLNNPFVTTDFSESQLELVTPPFNSVEKTYNHLKKTQTKVEKVIGEELLWPLSMPPRLPEEDKIPIAKFNDSKEGKINELYRKGLAFRYGKKMQMISGLHYNFSLSDNMINFLYEKINDGKEKKNFINEVYFSIIKNYMRYQWLLIYLFGASPVAHSSYDSVINSQFNKIVKYCPKCCNVVEKYKYYATSLRVSRFGYYNEINNEYKILFNSLDEYIFKIRKLLSIKSKKYMKLGRSYNKPVQLNDNILQKESEYYSSIRPKQIAKNNETQLDALEKRGVKYLEARIFDLNPFEKVGISIEQLYFIQVFMLFCLFEDSEQITKSEMSIINNNHNLVSLCGRKPNVSIYKYDNQKYLLSDWSKEVFEKLRLIASIMDQNNLSQKYKKSVEKEFEKILNPKLLPSSIIFNKIEDNNESYLDFGIKRCKLNSIL